jgi:hypothetical protein
MEEALLHRALATLQAEHLLLRSTLCWDGDSCSFLPTAAPVPVGVLPQMASGAWKPAAKAALRQRFSGDGDPLWRITWLRGAEGGELLLTFHHAIADGLSAMAVVQRLFTLLAALGDGSAPVPAVDWDALTPDLEQAFPRTPLKGEQISTLPDRKDVGLATSYALAELSAPASQAVLAWTRRRGLRLNATLHAAFLQSLVAAGVLPTDTLATTVVNLRRLAQPALPWELMRLLRVCDAETGQVQQPLELRLLNDPVIGGGRMAGRVRPQPAGHDRRDSAPLKQAWPGLAGEAPDLVYSRPEQGVRVTELAMGQAGPAWTGTPLFS